MVIVAGTVTPLAVLLLESVIVRPPAGAALERRTVPVDDCPAVTVDWKSVNDDRTGAVTARVADSDAPLNVPVIVAVRLEATAVVDTVNVALR